MEHIIQINGNSAIKISKNCFILMKNYRGAWRNVCSYTQLDAFLKMILKEHICSSEDITTISKMLNIIEAWNKEVVPVLFRDFHGKE